MILADYFKTLRRYWLFIILVAVGCAAAAFAFSKLQETKYEATSAVAVHNASESLGDLGRGVMTSDTPLQLASGHSSQVTRPAVLKQVQKDVKKAAHQNLTTSEIRSM